MNSIGCAPARLACRYGLLKFFQALDSPNSSPQCWPHGQPADFCFGSDGADRISRSIPRDSWLERELRLHLSGSRPRVQQFPPHYTIESFTRLPTASAREVPLHLRHARPVGMGCSSPRHPERGGRRSRAPSAWAVAGPRHQSFAAVPADIACC
jgi:hypothetical protein